LAFTLSQTGGPGVPARRFSRLTNINAIHAHGESGTTSYQLDFAPKGRTVGATVFRPWISVDWTSLRKERWKFDPEIQIPLTLRGSIDLIRFPRSNDRGYSPPSRWDEE